MIDKIKVNGINYEVQDTNARQLLNKINEDLGNTDTKVQEIENDIIDLEESKANKSETYTQAEVNELIGAIKTVSMKIVPERPATGETNIIYLVPSKKSEQENIYDEYIYVNGKWELIGSTQIDLSDYVTVETLEDTEGVLNGRIDSVEETANSALDLANDLELTTQPDDLTITRNSDNKYQNVASILQSGGIQKYWRGTKNEFNSLEEKDANTLYEIMDDEETVLFEVDGNTIEFSPDNLLRVPNNIDLMFQAITYGNHESGYRKWRNGFIEQWGVATSGANGEVEFTMHQPHIDQNFSIFVEPREMGNFFHYAMPSGNQKFKMRIQTRDSQNMAVRFQWHSYGYYK